VLRRKKSLFIPPLLGGIFFASVQQADGKQVFLQDDDRKSLDQLSFCRQCLAFIPAKGVFPEFKRSTRSQTAAQVDETSR
jgi:hypothetical protein